MNETVSVIVTCYNHEKYIEQCLRSIYAQTYQNIELLVINDGSTDCSDEIIQKVIQDSPFRVTEYTYQENSGVCVTRNRGLKWIKGEFALFVDSDNYLEPDYIEQLLKVAIEKNADIIYGNLINADTKEIFMQAKKFDLHTYLSGNYIDNCSLIRTSKINDSRYDLNLNRKKLVDYDFLLSLVMNNNANPCRAEGANLNYRVLDESISRKDDHGSEKFYYEIYLYIMQKYIHSHVDVIVPAIKQNMFTLEDRLTDLINHLGDVTDYVHSLEAITKDSRELMQNLSQEKESLKSQNNQLHSDIAAIQLDNQELFNQKELVLHSVSYRLGNLFVKPVSYGMRVIRNPKLLRKAASKIKRVIFQQISKLPNPKKYFLRLLRNSGRKQNDYINPKRILIYVIYENQDKLQDYKLIFLEALAKISQETLIVVNGQLPAEDIEKLEKIGQVKLRNNSGYDTAAFRYGIKYLGETKISQFDELLLVNDTNVGPMSDLSTAFNKMAQRKLDFWGISYGEEQPDFTSYNKYGYIPIHLQSYFLVIEKSLLSFAGFYQYWEDIGDTDSRNKAIGKHETVFTRHFSDLGFRHGALVEDNEDSPMYIHPLSMIKNGVPLVKYTAFANFNNDKFAWQGLLRETEVPALLNFIRSETDYPIDVIDKIMLDVKNRRVKEHILIIDGVENAIPQLTKYRVENKVEQLQSLGYEVWKINLSGLQMGYAEHASHIIIYRAGFTDKLSELCRMAKKYHKPVLYDIDDLVIDTKYTDQLEYTQQISATEKRNYDAGVNNYKRMLQLCDGAVTTTGKLQEKLQHYKSLVLLNRNLASIELVEISNKHIKDYSNHSDEVKIGYFSGSITHNENFELIKPAVIDLLKEFPNLKLYLIGHLSIPDDIAAYKSQIVTHDFVEWQKLPELISQVDINLAPLVDSIFNQAKSEIKWIEAALVKVPTIASNIGAFAEMVEDEETGMLVDDDEWYDKLALMIQSPVLRKKIADKAHSYVIKNCTIDRHEDELTKYVGSSRNESVEE